MAFYLGILIFSFIVTAIVIPIFINWLYATSPQHKNSLGGGVLVLIVVACLFALFFGLTRTVGIHVTSLFALTQEVHVIFFAWKAFGLLGLFGQNLKYRALYQLGLSSIVALLLFINLKIHIVNILFFGVLDLSWGFIVFAIGVISLFIQGISKTDEIDGLSPGVLLICLLALWALSLQTVDTALSTFIALWIGSLIAFLYFNIYPARILLGLPARLAFGATLAVIGLLLGKTIALLVIGGIFWLASLVKVFEKAGWSKPKIMLRGWLMGVILAIFGLWLAQL